MSWNINDNITFGCWILYNYHFIQSILIIIIYSNSEEKIIIENLIDKNLIGGIKVLHAGVSIDISLKVRLEELKAVL